MIDSDALLITSAGHTTAPTNTIDNPTHIIPVTTTFKTAAGTWRYLIPVHSIQVLEM